MRFLHSRLCMPQTAQRTIAEVGGRVFFFRWESGYLWDDNIIGESGVREKLFAPIAPYRKWWSSQASIHAGQDDEFLEAAAQSGCKQLFLGWVYLSAKHK